MALFRAPLASAGNVGATTLRPGVLQKNASTDWEWKRAPPGTTP
jgi:hypothetical protein